MSLLDMLRERDKLAEQTEMKATLTNIMAERFDPKEDITPYEIALILKMFSIVSVKGLSAETRKEIFDKNLDRHFLPAK